MIQINSKNINFENLEKKIDHKIKSTKVRNLQQEHVEVEYVPEEKIAQDIYVKKEIYEINDFIKYDNVEFINYIYYALLDRPADPDALIHYLTLLHTGERTKLEILLSIRYSPEGKKNNVLILGAKKRYLKTLLYKVPVLGYGLKTLETLLRIPKLLKRVNSLEAMLSTKALATDLHQTQHSLNQALHNLHKEVNKKVNLEDFHRDIRAKADKTELDTKVNLDDFHKDIKRKVDIDDFVKEVSKKVNLEDFYKDIETKVDKNSFYKEIEKKVNLSDFHKDMHTHQQTTKETLDAQNSKMEVFEKDIQTANSYLKYVEANLQKLVDKAEETMQLTGQTDNTMLNALVQEKEHILDALYLSFEDKFRGSRSDIKKRQTYYLPIVQEVIESDGLLLDIGCGRGEWLELLKENSIQAKGLDLNRLMVESSKEYGLDVQNGDAIAYLKSLEDESLDVITAFHIVEHLPFEVLISLFDESLRVLKKGGIIIFETPNPENLFVGACSFYTDPTHINPIPPVTLEFLASNRGFSDVVIHRLHPLKEVTLNKEQDADINNLILASTKAQDYSIIGTK